MSKTEALSAVVFFDVDGTLTKNGRPPSARVAGSIKSLARRGHIPVLCTGRPACHLDGVLAALPWAGVVTLAGADIRVGGRKVAEKVIPYALMREVIRRLEEDGIPALLENTAACCWMNPRNEKMRGKDSRCVSMQDVETQFPGLPFAKVVLEDSCLSWVARHGDFLHRYFVVSDIAVGFHEFTLPDINKKTAVEQVLRVLRHGRENTYAIGDSENDLGMLEAVQTPIVMGNALAQVKAKAAWVTDSVEKDGVYTALRHFGLL